MESEMISPEIKLKDISSMTVENSDMEIEERNPMSITPTGIQVDKELEWMSPIKRAMLIEKKT